MLDEVDFHDEQMPAGCERVHGALEQRRRSPTTRGTNTSRAPATAPTTRPSGTRHILREPEHKFHERESRASAGRPPSAMRAMPDARQIGRMADRPPARLALRLHQQRAPRRRATNQDLKEITHGHRRARDRSDRQPAAHAEIASLLLTRTKALAVAAAGWIFALSMVAWGPAHNSDVHLNRAGFWIPWVIVLAICLLIVAGIDRFKRRAATPTGSQTLA